MKTPKYFGYDPSSKEGDVTMYEVYTKAESAEEAAGWLINGSTWVIREILTREEYEKKYGFNEGL